MLLEELIVQNDEINEFNKSFVNTLRIITLICPDGNVKVITATMRFGREGKIADNYHHKGIAALVDIETGIIYTTGTDKEGNRYIVHSDSQKLIVGHKIPMWNQVIL